MKVYVPDSENFSLSVMYFINQCPYVIRVIYAHLFGNTLKCFPGFINCLCRNVIDGDLACGVAVGLFFLLRGRFGTETLSCA
ncbi:hypothetical protein D7V82_07865 [bacterium 1xD8-6]|nr:hypothetical protein D7V72_08830 [bacterium D16-36]RKI70397.1 hypothetical protein D7V82_07865 [bacterium 1xD8-6]